MDKEKTELYKYYLDDSEDNTLEFRKGITEINQETRNEISQEAARECEYMIIGKDVETINTNAVKDFIALTDVDILDGVKKVEAGAFAGCNALNYMEIPKSIESFKNGAWPFLTDRDNVLEIWYSGRDIGPYVHHMIETLTDENGSISEEINIFESAKAQINEIKEHEQVVFDKETHTLLFKNGITILNSFIGKHKWVDEVEHVILPESVTEIGAGTFYNWDALQTVTMTDNVTEIGKRAFSNCCRLNQVSLSSNLQVIRESLFDKDNNLSTIEIPARVASIEVNSFRGTNIHSLTLPDALENFEMNEQYAANTRIMSGNIYYRGQLITETLCNLSFSFNKVRRMILSGIPLNSTVFLHLRNLSNDELFDAFIENFKVLGVLGITEGANCRIDPEIKEKLEQLFKADPRFHGHTPRIINGLSIVTNILKFDPEIVVKTFSIDKTRTYLSKDIAITDGVLFEMYLNDSEFEAATVSKYRSQITEMLLSYARDNNKINELNTAKWIAVHDTTNSELIDFMIKNTDQTKISDKTTTEEIRAQKNVWESMAEVRNVERKYRAVNFKFSECEFDLKFTETTVGNHHMFLMRPGDGRMVTLGFSTHCCQKLNGAGESAMMHGLLNPKAGFWAMENVNTGKILAMAEVWETRDGKTLVFDNIEFADDKEVNRYKDSIGVWLAESNYDKIIMGLGYNAMVDPNMRKVNKNTYPWITAKECYILNQNSCYSEIRSIEDAEKFLAGKKDADIYSHFIYTDVLSHGCIYMKHHKEVEPYFAKLVKEKKETEKNSERSDENKESKLQSEKDESQNYVVGYQIVNPSIAGFERIEQPIEREPYEYLDAEEVREIEEEI